MKPNTIVRLLRQQTQRIIQLEKMKAVQDSQFLAHEKLAKDLGAQLWVTTKIMHTLRTQNAYLTMMMESQNERLGRLEAMFVDDSSGFKDWKK